MVVTPSKRYFFHLRYVSSNLVKLFTRPCQLYNDLRRMIKETSLLAIGEHEFLLKDYLLFTLKKASKCWRRTLLFENTKVSHIQIEIGLIDYPSPKIIAQRFNSIWREGVCRNSRKKDKSNVLADQYLRPNGLQYMEGELFSVPRILNAL